MHTYKHTYMFACIHTYIHTYMFACMHTYIHACIHTYMFACIHTYIHTYVHTCMHTYINTLHTYIRTYIYMNMLIRAIQICKYACNIPLYQITYNIPPVHNLSYGLILNETQFRITMVESLEAEFQNDITLLPGFMKIVQLTENVLGNTNIHYARLLISDYHNASKKMHFNFPSPRSDTTSLPKFSILSSYLPLSNVQLYMISLAQQ